MSELVQIGGHPRGRLAAMRRDAWWLEPLWTGTGFALFSLYTTVVMLYGRHYYAAPYLSPMYSPPLFVDPTQPGSLPLDHAWIGELPSFGFWPTVLPLTPAMFILIFPLSFRLTCYYYRKFYYRAYFASPPACAVNPVPQGRYQGETTLLLIQNLHRYALYAAIAFVLILSYDALLAFSKDGVLGFGVGTLVLTVNPILLGCYTFGCHSFRHLVGGRSDVQGPLQRWLWQRVSWLNARHMKFAWASMLWVWFADAYVRMVSVGWITDLNTWG
jgi:hypothetical protein